MELFAIIISTLSLATNGYIVWLLNRRFAPATLETFEFEPVERVSEVFVPEPVEVPSEPVADESHSAWRNIKEVQTAVPSISPSQPPPKPGPLERPSGFYR